MVLAAIGGMPPKHFHAHDKSFRLEYYRRAYAAIDAYEAALSDAGYVIVPIYPTEVMQNRAAASVGISPGMADHAFRTMIFAAPNTTDRSAPTARSDPL